MEASNQHGVSCSVSILRRAGYNMETLDVSSIDEDDSCTHYLGDSTNGNSLCALVPRPSVYMDWAMDPLSLQVEEDCPACGCYSLSFLTKLLGCQDTSRGIVSVLQPPPPHHPSHPPHKSLAKQSFNYIQAKLGFLQK